VAIYKYEKGLLRLQPRQFGEQGGKTIKNLLKLSAIAFFHFLCWRLFSPLFDVFSPEKKREGN
jgi:hypothetical protein